MFQDFLHDDFFLLLLLDFERLAAAVGDFFECFEMFFDEFHVFDAQLVGDDAQVAAGVYIAYTSPSDNYTKKQRGREFVSKHRVRLCRIRWENKNQEDSRDIHTFNMHNLRIIKSPYHHPTSPHGTIRTT